MIKQLGIVAACAIIGSACGLADIGSEAAEVEIVNAEDSIDGQAPDQDTTLSSESDTDTGDSTGTETDGDEPVIDSDFEELTAPFPAAGDGLIDVALAENISLASEDSRMETDPARETSGWGFLTVDGAYSTDQFNGQTPTDGSKFVVIEYELLSAEVTIFSNSAFRLQVDGTSYSPIVGFEGVISTAEVVNTGMVFEVPASVQTLQLEGGAPSDSVDGFTTIFDIELSPYDASNAEMALPPKFTDAEVEATAAEIELISEDNVTSIALDSPTNAPGEFTVDAAYSTAQLGDVAAGPDYKFLVVDYQMLGGDFSLISEQTFRIKTEGERYGPVKEIHKTIQTGEVVNNSIIFLVPRHTSEYVLESGSPDEWESGFTVAYEFWLPEPGTGSGPSTDTNSETDEAVGTVEAKATSIVLTSDDNKITTNLSWVNQGWGTLTIDQARTTAKMGRDGAGPGYKLVVVDYQMVAAESGNFLGHAFRLEAGGELYSPLTELSEIMEADEVFSGSLVFRVPNGSKTVTLEAGVIEGSEKGFRTTYEISFT